MVERRRKEELTAPAAHLVGVRPATDGRGLLVSHISCDAAAVYVPPMPLHEVVLAIDIINAVIGHECPPGQGDNRAGD